MATNRTPNAGAASAADAGAPAPVTPPARRRFLRRFGWVLGGLAAVELTWVVSSFLRPRPRLRGTPEEAGVMIAGPAERFAPGSVTAYPQGKFYLVRLEDGGFLALHRRCTHLGCTVPWVAAENRFACPCHASTFAITGEVLGPPAPRPLDTFAVRIENGVVKVDTTRPHRRAEFRRDQVAYVG